MDGRPVVLVPQKDLSRAKGRMSLPAPQRRDVAVTMLRNTLSAALASHARQVLVVLDDRRDAGEVADLDVLAFGPGVTGMNPSLTAAEEVVRMLWGEVPLLVVPADLPLVTPELLNRAMDIAAPHGRAFIPDRWSSGTTLLFAGARSALRPAYGPGSANAHERQGATCLREESLDPLRHDVDDLSDLDAARRRLELGSLREGTA